MISSKTSVVGNLFQRLGYAMLLPGFAPDNTPVETAATLGALGVSLALSAVWGGRRPAHAPAQLLRHHKTPAGCLLIHLLWLSGVAAVLIWMYDYRARREDDLGTVSAQWLHEYRCQTHQNG
jgi:hypothetical protein